MLWDQGQVFPIDQHSSFIYDIAFGLLLEVKWESYPTYMLRL